MQNALTIDVEDWRQLVLWKMSGEVVPPSPDVVGEMDYILDTLATRRIQATFFILANIAQHFPDLVRRVRDSGHEIACHGWSHSLIYRQTPEVFRDETFRAKQLLERVTGDSVRGYRAAEFSITRASWWALDVLAEAGFDYDSSVFPITGRRYGVPDSPLDVHTVETEGGRRITEVPMTAVEWFGRRWPAAGGGYLRLFPYAVTAGAIREVNLRGRPAVVYVHPYEFAPRMLRSPVAARSWRAYKTLVRTGLVHNLARGGIRHRFERLLDEFSFSPVERLVQRVDRSQTVLE